MKNNLKSLSALVYNLFQLFKKINISKIWIFWTFEIYLAVVIYGKMKYTLFLK